ncbi:hypothetical protein [Sinomonas atrocyanea]
MSSTTPDPVPEELPEETPIVTTLGEAFAAAAVTAFTLSWLFTITGLESCDWDAELVRWGAQRLAVPAATPPPTRPATSMPPTSTPVPQRPFCPGRWFAGRKNEFPWLPGWPCCPYCGWP